MITLRKSEDRGHFDLGWLDTYHTFSFDRYYDPAHLHFRSLRVINEDRVAPGQGFPAHSHSEFNSSRDQIVHLLQIWIMPDGRNLPPSYEQKFFTADDRSGRLRLIASPDGSAGSVRIHQDARVYAALLNHSQSIEHALPPNRYAWIQVARGTLTVNDLELKAGDGAAVSAEQKLKIGAGENAELLLFDLA